MRELIDELKEKIVTTLGLTDITTDSIEDDMPLIQEGLGLDSIDVLELLVLLEKDYGVRVENKELGKQVFQSVRTMAEFVEKNRTS